LLGLRLTRRDLYVILAVGALTPLVDSRVEVWLVRLFIDLRDVVNVFDFTGGPLNSDFLVVWEEYGAVLAAYLVRKPGAATLALTINGFGQFVIDGFQGPHHLFYGAAGLGADLVFASFRYRRFDAVTSGLAGVACQLFWIPFTYVYHDVFSRFPISFLVNDVITRVVGGAIGDGLLGLVLGFLVLKVVHRVYGIRGSGRRFVPLTFAHLILQTSRRRGFWPARCRNSGQLRSTDSAPAPGERYGHRGMLEWFRPLRNGKGRPA
jgi:ABC-type thiamin/hydroxymethylpyrimidine transport system permease subunit